MYLLIKKNIKDRICITIRVIKKSLLFTAYTKNYVLLKELLFILLMTYS